MINDLDTNAQQWKYVDDTTVSEVVVKGGESHVQAIANRVIEWSHENRVQLNADKCKELSISFAKEQRVFDPIIIEGKEVELVTSTKLLGLTIANDLSWNDHVTEITKKASKRLYFLTQLKRAGVPNWPNSLNFEYSREKCYFSANRRWLLLVFALTQPSIDSASNKTIFSQI